MQVTTLGRILLEKLIFAQENQEDPPQPFKELED